MRSALPCVILAAAFASTALADAVRYDRFYPQDAFLVTVDQRATLQSALDAHQVIRLDPKADYFTGGPPSITLRTGNRIYGVRTRMPRIIVEPGTQNAVVSGLSATTIEFPASTTATRHNIFRRNNYMVYTATGAVLEDNLFLDAAWSDIRLDASMSGAIRNNRIIRAQSQYNVLPPNSALRIHGNAATPSGGNTILWLNSLGQSHYDFQGLPDLSVVSADVESYYGTVGEAGPPSFRFGPMGTARMFLSSGNVRVGYPFEIEATNFWSIGNGLGSYFGTSPFLLKPGSQSAYVWAPGTQVDAATTIAAQNGVDSYEMVGFHRYGHEASHMIVNFDGAEKPSSLTQPEQDRMTQVMMSNHGEAWEAPYHAPIPDPAGPEWNVGLASKLSVSTDPTLAGKFSSNADIAERLAANGYAYLPAGIYYIDEPIHLGRNTLALMGDGMDSTVIISRDPTMDMVVFDSIPEGQGVFGMNITDLTLQGGANGIHAFWTEGQSLQLYATGMSHVTFRNMTGAGIRIEDIYAWDNNFFDHLYFYGNAIGLQHVATPCAGVCSDADKKLNYLDKNVFFQCQFVANGRGVDVESGRASGLNTFVNTLFKDNTQFAFRASGGYFNNLLANSDFINNAGDPVIYGGGDVSLLGSRVRADQRGTTMVDSTYYVGISDTTFSMGSSTTATIMRYHPFTPGVDHPDNIANYEKRRIMITNSQGDMPLGVHKFGMLVNNNFPATPSRSQRAAYVIDNVATSLISGNSTPQAQFLVGSVFPTGVSGGTGYPGNLSEAPPTITQHPVSISVVAGATVEFTAAASGGTLSWQWERDNSDIPGAMGSSYSFTAQATDDGAQFRVRVTNSAGPTHSNAATLTVTTAPPADAGVPDVDAGFVESDAGVPVADAGVLVADAGTPVSVDGGAPAQDAGVTVVADAGSDSSADAGKSESTASGCACNGVDATPSAALALLLLLRRKRKA